MEVVDNYTDFFLCLVSYWLFSLSESGFGEIEKGKGKLKPADLILGRKPDAESPELKAQIHTNIFSTFTEWNDRSFILTRMHFLFRLSY